MNQLNPLAILAAVLFNIGKTETLKVKPDDAQEEIDMQCGIVGIESEDDTVVCVLPLAKVLQCQQAPYDVRLDVDNGHLIMSFEKQTDQPTILTPDGNKIAMQSSKVQTLLERLK